MMRMTVLGLLHTAEANLILFDQIRGSSFFKVKFGTP